VASCYPFAPFSPANGGILRARNVNLRFDHAEVMSSLGGFLLRVEVEILALYRFK
jgi:hypothetical protein